MKAQARTMEDENWGVTVEHLSSACSQMSEIRKVLIMSKNSSQLARKIDKVQIQWKHLSEFMEQMRALILGPLLYLAQKKIKG